MTVYKLIGHNINQRQMASRGHAITFSHDGPKSFIANQTFPRIHNVKEYLSVCFVGSELQWVAFRPSFKTRVPNLVVRPQVVYKWLQALKHVNPLYKDIVILEDDITIDALNNITDEITNNVTAVKIK